ncbi:hypothetical protein Leryth_003457 [Lithospermum erythrorhizon]|nr:hypothetical protein Leryth_003457 [Lithospermum erythrorhizon]
MISAQVSGSEMISNIEYSQHSSKEIRNINEMIEDTINIGKQSTMEEVIMDNQNCDANNIDMHDLLLS